MARELNVIKVPRSDPILDQRISFAPLQNLHLDLMEVKKKLKKGLPVVTVAKAPSPAPSIVIPVRKTVVDKPSISKPKLIEKTNEVDELEIEVPDDDSPDDVAEDEEKEANEEDGEMLNDLGEDDIGGGENSLKDGEDFGGGNVENETVGEPDPHEGMTPEQIEAQEKEEYIWRFKILKKQYKERDIPSFNEHDDLPHMKTTYNRLLKEIHLENNVDSYRTYLVGGFMAMEFVFTNWLGFDIKGFAVQQMTMMDKYDIMLIELGERSYNRFGTTLPVEIRLIGFILMQAVLFYLAKIITDKAGDNIGTIFRGITGQGKPITPPSNAAATPEAPVKKMRGPSIKITDIKKSEE